MDASAWIALASLAVVVFGQAVALAFLLGGLFNRMKVVEGRPSDLDCRSELAVLNTKFAALEKTLSDMATDLKGLLTGRIGPGRRRVGDDA